MRLFLLFLLLSFQNGAQTPIQGKSLHIDFVQFLEESGEYALKLSFLPNVNPTDWYDSLEFHFTQPKYQEDAEYARYDAPEALIQRYFHTDRLEDMKLYSTDNAYVGDGIFQGFEYINQNIEPKIVAVYRKSADPMDTALYAICGLEEQLRRCPLLAYLKNDAMSNLEGHLVARGVEELHTLEVGNCQNVHFMTPQGYIVTADTEENYSIETVANLYIEVNGVAQEVHQLHDGWLYWHLRPLEIYYKGYPIVLLEKAMMDSDWFDQSILIWNDTTSAYEEKPVRFELE